MTSKRDISAANEAALLGGNVRLVLFARLDFSSGVQRYHTEIGPLQATHPIFGSETYTGLGDFGGISGEIIESVAAAPQKVTLLITGADPTISDLVLLDDYHRRDAELMIGLFDDNNTLIDDPVIVFSGFMDTSSINLNAGLANISLTCESRGTNLQRTSDQRFTDEDKQAEVSGDVFAEYVFRMLDITLRWGDSDFRTPLRYDNRNRRGPNRFDPRVTQ